MKILAVGAVTFRDILRRKVQVNLLLFGGVLITASYILSTLTLGDMHRIISDLGLSAMRFVGTLLASFLGASMIAGDIEKRVVYSVVSKPTSRTEYLVGRYVGLAAAVLANLLVMALLLAAILAATGRGLTTLDAAFVAAVGLMAVQFLVVSAVAVFFSSITNATLAAIFTLAIAVAGQLTNEMRSLWKSGPTWVAKVVWYAVPNLGALNANEAVIYRTPPAAAHWIAALYGCLYAATALTLAAAIFERRDLR